MFEFDGEENNLERYTIFSLKKVQETGNKVKKVSKSEFSANVEPKKTRICIFLHPLSQLHTTPEPQDVVNRLKSYFLKALQDEGIDIDKTEINRVLNPILKDFLEEILNIAKETKVEPPECYESLYKEL